MYSIDPLPSCGAAVPVEYKMESEVTYSVVFSPCRGSLTTLKYDPSEDTFPFLSK